MEVGDHGHDPDRAQSGEGSAYHCVRHTGHQVPPGCRHFVLCAHGKDQKSAGSQANIYTAHERESGEFTDVVQTSSTVTEAVDTIRLMHTLCPQFLCLHATLPALAILTTHTVKCSPAALILSSCEAPSPYPPTVPPLQEPQSTQKIKYHSKQTYLKKIISQS